MSLPARVIQQEQSISPLAGRPLRSGALLAERLSQRYADRITGHFTLPGRAGRYEPIPFDVAGGMRLDGVYLDAHSDAVPDAVWALLEYTLPRCPNVGPVVFELFGSWFDVVGEARVRADLRRMKRLWQSCQPQPAVTCELDFKVAA